MNTYTDPGPMVVGHRPRYQNRIVSRPKAFAPDNDASRVPQSADDSGGERLPLSRELYWFLIELAPPFAADGERITRPGFAFSPQQRQLLAADAEDVDSGDSPIEEVLNLTVRTQGTGDLRTHDGTPVINLPYRATPEYTVPSFANRPFSREEMKSRDEYRPLSEDAVIRCQDDIVFVRIPDWSATASGDNRAVYLLFDWIALNCLSDQQFVRIFSDDQDVLHVTDADVGQTLDQAVIEAYLNVNRRVLELTGLA